MSRPRPGDWQAKYWALGRIDLAKTNERGWWLTIWACRPAPRPRRCRVLNELWLGPVRIVRQVHVLP